MNGLRGWSRARIGATAFGGLVALVAIAAVVARARDGDDPQHGAPVPTVATAPPPAPPTVPATATSPAASPTEFPPATMAWPQTTMAGQPPASLADPAPLSPADADELPCRDLPSSDSGTGPSIEEAGRLEPTLGVVLAYGQEHADSWGGYGLVWHDAADASVVIGVTRDVAEHRALLEDRVPLPGELIVCRSPLTMADRSALVAEIDPELRGRAASWSPGWSGGVVITLRPEHEAFAAELVERYGERVELTVGTFPYPMPDPVPSDTCTTVPDADTIDGLELTVVPPTGAIDPAAQPDSAIAVSFRNGRATELSLSIGTPLALLVEPGTDRVVGRFTGGMGLALDHIVVAPGEEATRSALVGVSSCDPALGYRLPAGTYDVVVLVDRGGIGDLPLLTPRIAVEIA